MLSQMIWLLLKGRERCSNLNATPITLSSQSPASVYVLLLSVRICWRSLIQPPHRYEPNLDIKKMIPSQFVCLLEIYIF